MHISSLHKTRWKQSELIQLFENIELYLTAGIPLNQSLRILKDHHTPPKQASLETISSALEQGYLFSDSCTHTLRTSPLITSLVRHGEYSGTLSESITIARTLLEHRQSVIKKCTSALMYPAVIGVFASVMTIGLIKGVLPSIIPMLLSMHIPLPPITRCVIWLSETLSHYGIYMSIGLLVLFLTLYMLYTRYYRVKYLTHVILLHTPIVGPLARNYTIGLFLQSCGSLLNNGLTIEDAYTRTVHTISLQPIHRYFVSRIPDISNGTRLAIICTHPFCVPHIPALIAAGEASGNLGQSCIRASRIIDKITDHSLKQLTSLIEPLMMVCMGVVVGGIALSIMMPIYALSNILQH